MDMASLEIQLRYAKIFGIFNAIGWAAIIASFFVIAIDPCAYLKQCKTEDEAKQVQIAMMIVGAFYAIPFVIALLLIVALFKKSGRLLRVWVKIMYVCGIAISALMIIYSIVNFCSLSLAPGFVNLSVGIMSAAYILFTAFMIDSLGMALLM